MSGWHPEPRDGGIPPNPAIPTSPAQAYSPSVMPIDADALYYGNGCDVRLRPHVLNTLISEGLSLIDSIGLPYRPGRLTNLRMGVQYIVQKGLPRWVVLNMQSAPVRMYLGTLDPPVLNGLNNGMSLNVLPTAMNDGSVKIDVGNGSWIPVLRNDAEELEAGDWPANIPQQIIFCDDKWFMLTFVRSQVGGVAGGGAFKLTIWDVAGTHQYTPNPGSNLAAVIATGSGGGGANWGSGGAAGATAMELVDLSSIGIGPYLVKVGKGGALAGAAGYPHVNGGAGEESSIGPWVSAGGGKGGLYGTNYGPQFACPQEGGIATVGRLKINGAPGGPALVGTGSMAGHGAPSFWGGGGMAAEANQSRIVGQAGVLGAGGGSGFYGGANRHSGAGGDGICIALEF